MEKVILSQSRTDGKQLIGGSAAECGPAAKRLSVSTVPAIVLNLQPLEPSWAAIGDALGRPTYW